MFGEDIPLQLSSNVLQVLKIMRSAAGMYPKGKLIRPSLTGFLAHVQVTLLLCEIRDTLHHSDSSKRRNQLFLFSPQNISYFWKNVFCSSAIFFIFISLRKILYTFIFEKKKIYVCPKQHINVFCFLLLERQFLRISSFTKH